MDLGERGGAHGLGIDPIEDLGQRPAEVLLDLAGDLLEPFGRDLVLKAGELAGDLGRQDVHPRGEELAQLDEEAAHLRGQGTVPTGDLLPPLEGRTPEAPQSRDVEDEVPPEDVDEHAGHEAAHLAVAPEVDSRGHGGTI